MGIKLVWAGVVCIAAGLVAGFVKSGECGSVFQPRDTRTDAVNDVWAQLNGQPPWSPDCRTALDLTAAVWVLGVVGVALVVAGIVARASRPVSQVTAEPHD